MFKLQSSSRLLCLPYSADRGFRWPWGVEFRCYPGQECSIKAPELFMGTQKVTNWSAIVPQFADLLSVGSTAAWMASHGWAHNVWAGRYTIAPQRSSFAREWIDTMFCAGMNEDNALRSQEFPGTTIVVNSSGNNPEEYMRVRFGSFVRESQTEW